MPLAVIFFVICTLVAAPLRAPDSSVSILSAGRLRAQGTSQTTSSAAPANPPEQNTPDGSAAAEQTSPSASPAEEPKPASNPTRPAVATKPHRRKRKPAPRTDSNPPKTVVSDGSTTNPKTQIAPSVTQSQASRQRQNTSQLLAATDLNLKKLSGRQLSGNQQDTMKQIRAYMEQAKSADAAGELQRARNLAVKAHLL